MGVIKRETRIEGSNGVNFNQAQNTVLHTFTARGPSRIKRFGAIADSANGLLAAMDLKLRLVPQATGTAADIANTQLNGAVRARGQGIYKSVGVAGTPVADVQAGDEVTIAVETTAGAASTGDVWIEYEELPFVGSLVTNYVAST